MAVERPGRRDGREPGRRQNALARFGFLMAHRYLRHNVGSQSAALAFYLLFMLFPFLIFISALLGLLELDVAGITALLKDFLPEEAVELLGAYLGYVRDEPSPRLMVFGLVFSVYFPMRAANALMRSVRTAYHLGPPRQVVRHWLRVLIYTVSLIVTIVLTLTLMTVGERVIGYAVRQLRLPALVGRLWVWLRFPAAALALFFTLLLLYALAQDSRPPWRELWPGVLGGLLAWMLVSWLYAFYADYIARYSLLYGSIGAVMVVLIWLYLTAMTLILGAEMNGALLSMEKDRRSGGE